MTDSLSQREIEDVLSSIRRLVSQEVARASSERLLLTPALRVVSGTSRTGAPAECAPAAVQADAALRAAPSAEQDRAAFPSAGGDIPRPDPDPEATDPAAAAAALHDSDAGGTGRQDPEIAQPGDAVPAVALDRAALRDMATEVLREELRGALGEKMTRVIRKLVRAEVARALNAREYL